MVMRTPAPTPSPRRALDIVVFEIFNPVRREAYIGSSEMLLTGALTDPRLMSRKLAHWRAGEALEVRLLDPRVAPGDYPDLIARRARELAGDGWTSITDL